MDCMDISENIYSFSLDESYTTQLKFKDKFLIANIENPEKFVSNLKEQPDTKKLVDFKKGTTTLGFVTNDGVIIAVDSRASMGSYISSQTVRKVIEINEYLLGTMAGGAADCAFWERHLARLCRLFELRNRERISVAAASNLLASIFFKYRGYGLCCGTMIAGWNLSSECGELFYVDDKGNRIKGDIFSVGSGSTYAYGVLDNNYKKDMPLSDAIELGKKAIYHATHRDGASGGVVRVYHIHKNGWTKIEDGKDVSELHYEYMEAKKN